jgi:hypothetical protein
MNDTHRNFEWWVRSKARISGHRSHYGPFVSVMDAAKWVEENRPPVDWKVAIHARIVKEMLRGRRS